MFACVYTCVHECVFVHAACVCACVRACVRACVCVYLYTLVRMRASHGMDYFLPVNREKTENAQKSKARERPLDWLTSWNHGGGGGGGREGRNGGGRGLLALFHSRLHRR